jgi:carboxymethylenebutenolidase
VKEQTINIPTSAGTMETFVTCPEQAGPFPAVILYMDVWGVREVLFDLARRVATVGYYALVPDFYYRQGRIRTDYRDEHGHAISLKNLTPEQQETVLAPQRNLADSMVIQDTGAILQFLDAQADVKPGPIGGFGYCMGGRQVLQAAAAYPDRLRASASLHGTTLISDRPDSAHVGIKKFRGEVYCGFAEVDAYAPLPMVREWNRLMTSSSVKYFGEIHKGAEHGYALPDRDLYHKHGAERDWELILAMFHRQIPPAYADR